MKKFDIMFLVTLVLCVVASGCFAYYELDRTLEDYYSGKIVFETVGEYGDFKTALGDQNVYILKADILSSSPPIVATFKVSVPHDYYFQYGEMEDRSFAVIWGTGFVTLFAAVLSVFFTIFYAFCLRDRVNKCQT